MTRRRGLRVLLPLALLALAALTLTACSSNPKRSGTREGGGSGASWSDNTSLSQSKRYHRSNDSTPDIKGVDFSKIPEPVPEALPRSRYGNKSPYSVNGESYRVLPSAARYD